MVRNKTIRLKVSQDEFLSFRKKAESLGLSLASFLRLVAKKSKVAEITL